MNIYILDSIKTNDVFVLRDDLLPDYFGGNKVRIVNEYYDDMLSKKCDCLIVYGSRRSNMCRVAALLCNKKGIKCYVLYRCSNEEELLHQDSLNERIVKQTSANVSYCLKRDIKSNIERIFNEARMNGLKPYYIFGNSDGKGNESVGARAYAKTFEGILKYEQKQKRHFDYIFLASGTGITQSGLIIGNEMTNAKKKIIGLSIAREAYIQTTNIKTIVDEVLGNDNAEVIVDDSGLQGGYGCIDELRKKTDTEINCKI